MLKLLRMLPLLTVARKIGMRFRRLPRGHRLLKVLRRLIQLPRSLVLRMTPRVAREKELLFSQRLKREPGRLGNCPLLLHLSRYRFLPYNSRNHLFYPRSAEMPGKERQGRVLLWREQLWARVLG